MLAANMRSRVADLTDAAGLLDEKHYRHDPPAKSKKQQYTNDDTYLTWRG